jgi:hypothetical protein
MPQFERQREIKRRRNRFVKVHVLRDRLATEKDSKVRARLIARMKKIAPTAPVPEK